MFIRHILISLDPFWNPGQARTNNSTKRSKPVAHSGNAASSSTNGFTTKPLQTEIAPEFACSLTLGQPKFADIIFLGGGAKNALLSGNVICSA